MVTYTNLAYTLSTRQKLDRSAMTLLNASYMNPVVISFVVLLALLPISGEGADFAMGT